jgi:SAM-dependent methyltransferase
VTAGSELVWRALKTVGRRVLPEAAQQSIRARGWTIWPPLGRVRLGGVGRLTPISTVFGFDRGLPIDRYYIEDFLRRHAGAHGYTQGDIRGRVLEIGDDRYSRKFGRWPAQPGEGGGIEKVDVLNVGEGNPETTIVADLAAGDDIPSATFDCVICTQTLHLIYDVRGAVRTLHRILKPGGVVLATVPGLTRICRPDFDLWGDYWRFTSLSVRRLFEEVFRPADVTVDAYGNVLAAVAFLHGLAAEELKQPELELRDPNYEVLVAVRARKGDASG